MTMMDSQLKFPFQLVWAFEYASSKALVEVFQRILFFDAMQLLCCNHSNL